jgi:hypothetical protein
MTLLNAPPSSCSKVRSLEWLGAAVQWPPHTHRAIKRDLVSSSRPHQRSEQRIVHINTKSIRIDGVFKGCLTGMYGKGYTGLEWGKDLLVSTTTRMKGEDLLVSFESTD